LLDSERFDAETSLTSLQTTATNQEDNFGLVIFGLMIYLPFLASRRSIQKG
jgi:hypothetical protein